MKGRKLVGASVTLILVLALLCLAGCGQSPSAPAGGPGAPAQGGSQPSTGGAPAGEANPGEQSSPAAGAAGQGSPTELVAGADRVRELTRKGMAYDLFTTTPEGTTGMKVWMQAHQLKVEGTFGGEKMVSFLDTQAHTLITYYPDRNEAVKLTGEKPPTEAGSPGDYLKERDFAKARVIGSEVYDGARCRVILVAEENGGQAKMWVREDCGLPVRVETEVPGQGKTVVEYKNLQFGPFPPETFELPAGVKVTDLGEMLKQLQSTTGKP